MGFGFRIPASADDDDTMEYFLGKRPSGATTDSKVDLGMIVRDIDELVVLNDEAHHIHDPRMAWFKSIEDIHNRLKQKGAALSLQVDVTATPKHNNGAIFVQTVADYPLVEAISQNVVKHPVLPDAPSRAKLVERKSAKFTEKYADYIHLGVIEWRKAYAEHEKMGKKAILFVMTDDTRNCDDVAAYLEAKTTVRFPNQPQARAKKSWMSCASKRTRLMGWTTPTKPSSQSWCSKRVGTCATSPRSWACAPIPPRATSCPNRLWDGACENVRRWRGRICQRGRNGCVYGLRGVHPSGRCDA